MNVITAAFATLGGIVTIISILVSILLYAKGSYAKQKIEELREDRDDAQRRAEFAQEEASQARKALARCGQEAAHLRSENELFRNGPTLAVQQISQLIEKQTEAILKAVENGQRSP